MDLHQAATYFANDSVDGWNGTAWVTGVTKATVLPFDRFVSDQEWAGQGKTLLLEPTDTALETYPVIRLPSGQICLVGFRNFDTQDGVYSQIYSVYQAPDTAEVYSFTKAVAASGMAKTAARTKIGTYHCAVDHLTFQASKVFDNTRNDEDIIMLPRNCVIDNGNELRINGNFYYDVLETYLFSGFVCCRALKKRST